MKLAIIDRRGLSWTVVPELGEVDYESPSHESILFYAVERVARVADDYNNALDAIEIDLASSSRSAEEAGA